MLEISWAEILIVLIVLVLVCRPEDLPGMLYSFGKTFMKFRSFTTQFFDQFNIMFYNAERKETHKHFLEDFSFSSHPIESSVEDKSFQKKKESENASSPSSKKKRVKGKKILLKKEKQTENFLKKTKKKVRKRVEKDVG